MASAFSAFLAELKRRKVYNVAAVYAVVSFVIWQAAEIAFPALGLPPWTLTFVVTATLLGFPIALVLAWALEITPQGVKRTDSPAAGRGRWAPALAVLVIIAVVAGTAWYVLRDATPEPDRKSIAVLPLNNLSGDDATEPFVAGIHDDILTNLYKIADLKVISRTSVMEYQDTRKNLREIAGELGVATILEGGVQRAGDRVRINLQLIDARTDEHIWAENYDRALTTENIFSVQSDVALQVAAALRSVLSPSEKAQIEVRPTDNLEAYDYYLRGNEYHQRSEDLADQRIAIQLWTRATELDPSFPLPYAKLVGAQCMLHFGVVDRTEDHVALAAAAVAKLRELAPDLGETHQALGMYYYQCLGEFDRGMDEFTLAVALRPNDPQAHAGIAGVQRRRGHWAEAVESWVKTAELDPIFFGWPKELALTYTYMHEYARSDSAWNRAAALAPDDSGLYTWRAINRLSWTGDTHAARAIVEPALRGTDAVDLPELFHLLHLMDLYEGRYGRALDRLSAASSPTIENHFWVRTRAQLTAQVYALRGDAERARTYYDSARVYLEARIQEDPEDARLYRSLGIALAGLGQEQEAVRAAERARDLLPVSRDAVLGPESIAALARVYTMIGDYDAAVDQLDALLAVPTYHSAAWLRMDPAYTALRDYPRFRALTGSPPTGSMQ
ncbi:MAG: hypothetical protein P8Z36_09760 [Gemmatimonadota bacterium]|jgi:TolB-like protein